MDPALRVVIDAIHSSPTRAVLCLSGGAAQVSFVIYTSLYLPILLSALGYGFLKD